MSKPLDGLREALTKGLVGVNKMQALDRFTDAKMREQWVKALRCLDQFEAEHPGLMDKTRHCQKCGAVIELDYRQALDMATKWLCPACAKEAEHE